MNLYEVLRNKYGKELKDCSDREIYFALLEEVQKLSAEKVCSTGKKKLYYISAEFLVGKLLSNNLINLGIYDDVKKVLSENGRDICKIEEIEPEPSLGNGGLGRLAACFMDSIATLGLNGDGISLNYHYGLFRQKFENNLQTEEPDEWIEDKSWLERTNKVYDVKFKNLTVKSRMYNINVTRQHS